MRTRLLLSLALAAVAPASDLACFAKISIPKYPPLAAQAVISGSLRVEIPPPTLGDPDPAWTIEASHPMLKDMVAEIRTWAKPLPTCAGRRLTLIFDFRIDESLDPAYRGGFHSVELQFPQNTIAVTLRPREMHVQRVPLQ